MTCFFRAPKGTANFNAARTLMAGVVGAVLILVLADPAFRLWDQWLRPRPWVEATIRIVPSVSGMRPQILYAVLAQYPIDGTRTSWVEEGPDNARECRGEGSGGYYPGSAEKAWSWSSFLGANCAEPARPYRVCAAFIVETPRGVTGYFGPFCSALYDPTI